jgi:hypothetical protein
MVDITDIATNSTIIEELGSLPTTIFNPLINDLGQLMQVMQYFGSALIVLYVIFMLLRYLEARHTRILLDGLVKDVKSLKKGMNKLKSKRR